MKTSALSNLLGLGGCMLVAVAPPAAARDINERFMTGPVAHIELSNVSGSVRVAGWDRDEVLVTGDLHKNAEIDLVHDDERVSVKVIRKSGRGRAGSSDLRVKVPFDSELEVYVVSADIEVREVAGEQRLELVSGDVVVRGLQADLRVTSASGDIDVRGAESDSTTDNSQMQPSRIHVVSVSGSTRLRDVAGEVDVTTISGSNTVSGGRFDRVRLESTSGRIKFEGALEPSARLDVKAISGSVSLDIAGSDELDVNIETFSGGINNCFGEESRRKSKYGPGRILRFSRGAADRDIRVQAMSGSVSLCGK